MQAKVQVDAQNASSLVTLNLQGQHFAAPRHALLQHEGSYFHAMLSSGHWHPDAADGSYFIDRNPILFRTIFDYLTRGKIDVNAWSKQDKQELETDLDYFQISISPHQRRKAGLRVIRNRSRHSAMQWDIDTAPQGVKIDGLVAKSTVDGYRYISCDQPINGSCKLKLINISSMTSIGLATADKRKSQVWDCWRWYPFDGRHFEPSGLLVGCYYGLSAAAGSTVELFHDSQAGVISCAIDDKPKQELFKDVPLGLEFYLKVRLDKTGDAVEIV